AVSYRRVITPRIVNELTAGFSRFNLVHPRRGKPRFSERCAIFAANRRLPVHAVQPELLLASRSAEQAEHRGPWGVSAGNSVRAKAALLRGVRVLGVLCALARNWNSFVSDPARAGESSPEVFFLAKPQRTQRKIKQNVLLSAHQN